MNDPSRRPLHVTLSTLSTGSSKLSSVVLSASPMANSYSLAGDKIVKTTYKFWLFVRKESNKAVGDIVVCLHVVSVRRIFPSPNPVIAFRSQVPTLCLICIYCTVCHQSSITIVGNNEYIWQMYVAPLLEQYVWDFSNVMIITSFHISANIKSFFVCSVYLGLFVANSCSSFSSPLFTFPSCTVLYINHTDVPLMGRKCFEISPCFYDLLELRAVLDIVTKISKCGLFFKVHYCLFSL